MLRRGIGVGSSIAGRTLEAEIGRGGMGIVYKARNERLDRTEAVKVITDDLARDKSFRERFLREAMISVAVEHPHVIPVYDADEGSGGHLFIAMRYVEDGNNMARMISQRHQLDPRLAANLISAVASALDAAHARDLVHRDVKPTNVLIVGDRVYRDSAEIIAGLEVLKPDPPLIPVDPDERQRALLIQKEFDDIYGPAIRALGYQALLESPSTLASFMSYGGSPLRRLILRATTRAMIPGVRALHAVPETGDPRPLETTERALSRLDELLSESRTSYLVGDNFTVADLTVCALLAFGVCPDLVPGGGLPPWPAPLASRLADLADRHPSAGWVRATYRSHRNAHAPEPVRA